MLRPGGLGVYPRMMNSAVVGGNNVFLKLFKSISVHNFRTRGINVFRPCLNFSYKLSKLLTIE